MCEVEGMILFKVIAITLCFIALIFSGIRLYKEIKN